VCAVPNLFGMQSACAVSCCHLWPVCLYYVFHITSLTAQFSENITEQKKCCDFLYKFVWHFLIKKIKAGAIQKYKCLDVKYTTFFSDFNNTSILWTDFREILKHPISWKLVQLQLSCSMRQTDGQTEYRETDRQTDRQTDGDTNRKREVNGRFSQFCKGAHI
jgi:hypothetical protein